MYGIEGAVVCRNHAVPSGGGLVMFFQFCADMVRLFFFLLLPMGLIAGIPFYFVWKRDNKKIAAAREEYRRSRRPLQRQDPPQQPEQEVIPAAVAQTTLEAELA
jgi:hypothetical protein